MVYRLSVNCFDQAYKSRETQNHTDAVESVNLPNPAPPQPVLSSLGFMIQMVGCDGNPLSFVVDVLVYCS